MTENFDTEMAANLFVQKIYKEAFLSAIEGVNELLEKGPSGRKKGPTDLALHEWFESLDENSREKVRLTVQSSIKFSIYASLLVLDNLTVGPVLEEKPSDIALYIQTYKDYEAIGQNEPLLRTRLNQLMDLHDRFLEMLADNLHDIGE